MEIKRIATDICEYGHIEEKIEDINWKISTIEDEQELTDEWIEELNRKNEEIEKMMSKYVKLGRDRIIVYEVLMKAFLKIEEYMEEELEKGERYKEFVFMYESIAENKTRKEEKTSKIKIK